MNFEKRTVSAEGRTLSLILNFGIVKYFSEIAVAYALATEGGEGGICVQSMNYIACAPSKTEHDASGPSGGGGI